MVIQKQEEGKKTLQLFKNDAFKLHTVSQKTLAHTSCFVFQKPQARWSRQEERSGSSETHTQITHTQVNVGVCELPRPQTHSPTHEHKQREADTQGKLVWSLFLLRFGLFGFGSERLTLMLPDMVVLDPFLTALRADFLELAGLATTAFLEDITMEFMVVVCC